MVQYIRIFRNTLHIGAIVAIISVAIYSYWHFTYEQNRYEASSAIFVNEDVNSPYFTKNNTDEKQKKSVITDSNFAESLMRTTLRYINSSQYQQETIKRLEDQYPTIRFYNFEKNIKVETYAGTKLIKITGVAQSSELAAVIVNTLCDVYKETSAKKFGNDYFIFYSRAVANGNPINIPYYLGVILCVLGGIILSYVCVVFIDLIIKTEGQSMEWKFSRKKFVGRRTNKKEFGEGIYEEHCTAK